MNFIVKKGTFLYNRDTVGASCIVSSAELYVIFTGEKPKTPPDTISLSKDFFDGEKIAVTETIRICKDRNVLNNILKIRNRRLWIL